MGVPDMQGLGVVLVFGLVAMVVCAVAAIIGIPYGVWYLFQHLTWV